MGFYTTTPVTEKPHPETPSCAQKTASGKFFTYPIKTQYKNRHNSLKTKQEKPLHTHKTASGVFYYKFRHYSAELGRWLARDPIEEWGGYNLYEFVNSQPTWYWDYLGLHHRVPAAVKKILKDAKNTRQGRGRHPSGLKGATPNNLGVGTRLWTKGPYKSFAKNMKAHWKKHRGEFPEYNNLGDYVRGAHRELHTLGNLSKVRVAKNGDVGVYNPQNNSLTICNNKGVPKTHYKPDPKHPNYEPFEKKFPLEWDGKWVQ